MGWDTKVLCVTRKKNIPTYQTDPSSNVNICIKQTVQKSGRGNYIKNAKGRKIRRFEAENKSKYPSNSLTKVCHVMLRHVGAFSPRVHEPSPTSSWHPPRKGEHIIWLISASCGISSRPYYNNVTISCKFIVLYYRGLFFFPFQFVLF